MQMIIAFNSHSESDLFDSRLSDLMSSNSLLSDFLLLAGAEESKQKFLHFPCFGDRNVIETRKDSLRVF
jgi:hypothetical protein